MQLGESVTKHDVASISDRYKIFDSETQIYLSLVCNSWRRCLKPIIIQKAYIELSSQMLLFHQQLKILYWIYFIFISVSIP